MENLTRRDREKLVREEDIISAAEKIFCLKGFETASMDEIAKEAQFTKRTLYQYFEDKEDLYFAVALKVFKRLFSYLMVEYREQETGYIRIQQFCKNFYRFYKEDPETFRIISYIGYVRKKSANESKRLYEFMQFNNRMFETVGKVITEGKADGSIQGDWDSEKAAFSLIFLMTGFFNQLSVTGDSFTSHFSLNIEEFSRFTIDLLLGTFKKSGD